MAISLDNERLPTNNSLTAKATACELEALNCCHLSKKSEDRGKQNNTAMIMIEIYVIIYLFLYRI